MTHPNETKTETPLLKKYMQFIIDEEGSTFLHCLVNGRGTWGSTTFTENEMAELKRIEQEIEDE